MALLKFRIAVFIAVVMSLSFPAVGSVNPQKVQERFAAYQAAPQEEEAQALLMLADQMLREALRTDPINLPTQRAAIFKAELSFDIRKDILGKQNIRVVDAGYNLARLYTRRDWQSKGDEVLSEVYLMAKEILDPGDPYLADLLLALGNHRFSVGLEQATLLYQTAIDIYTNHYGPEHELVGVATERLARLHSVWGHPQRARELALKALSILKQQEDPITTSIAYAEISFAESFALTGEVGKAVDHLRQFLPTLDRSREIRTHFGCGALYMRWWNLSDEFERQYPFDRNDAYSGHREHQIRFIVNTQSAPS
jgi:tetratricopeptide (TPR) repeat protein